MEKTIDCDGDWLGIMFDKFLPFEP
jgi:hypothetical protein